MTEAAYQSGMRASASQHGLWLFRFNVGGAWAGKKIATLDNGDIVLRGARWVDFGPPVGFPDTAGWLRHEVRPCDVGKTLAVFSGVEFKSKTGPTREAQKTFHRVLLECGGLAVVARDGMTWEEILGEWHGKA